MTEQTSTFDVTEFKNPDELKIKFKRYLDLEKINV